MLILTELYNNGNNTSIVYSAVPRIYTIFLNADNVSNYPLLSILIQSALTSVSNYPHVQRTTISISSLKQKETISQMGANVLKTDLSNLLASIEEKDLPRVRLCARRTIFKSSWISKEKETRALGLLVFKTRWNPIGIVNGCGIRAKFEKSHLSPENFGQLCEKWVRSDGKTDGLVN